MALTYGGLGIGGVASSTDEDPMELSAQVGYMLHEQLTVRRRDIKVVPWYEIRQRVGDETVRAFLDELDRYGGPGPASLANVRSGLQGPPRYLLLARIEKDVVTRNVEKSETTVGDNTTVDGHWMISERNATVGFQVFDLVTARSVWAANISGKLETRRYEQEAEDWEDVLIDILLSDPDSDEFPPPPDSDMVLKEIFKTLANKLPKA